MSDIQLAEAGRRLRQADLPEPDLPDLRHRRRRRSLAAPSAFALALVFLAVGLWSVASNDSSITVPAQVARVPIAERTVELGEDALWPSAEVGGYESPELAASTFARNVLGWEEPVVRQIREDGSGVVELEVQVDSLPRLVLRTRLLDPARGWAIVDVGEGGLGVITDVGGSGGYLVDASAPPEGSVAVLVWLVSSGRQLPVAELAADERIEVEVNLRELEWALMVYLDENGAALTGVGASFG